MAELQKKARGERPRYFADPAVDKILSVTLALAGEVAVIRDRLDTIERLAADGRPINSEAVDEYQPTAEVRAARDRWRDTYLDLILRSIHQEREHLERRAEHAPYEDAVSSVGKD